MFNILTHAPGSLCRSDLLHICGRLRALVAWPNAWQSCDLSIMAPGFVQLRHDIAGRNSLCSESCSILSSVHLASMVVWLAHHITCCNTQCRAIPLLHSCGSQINRLLHSHAALSAQIISSEELLTCSCCGCSSVLGSWFACARQNNMHASVASCYHGPTASRHGDWLLYQLQTTRTFFRCPSAIPV